MEHVAATGRGRPRAAGPSPTGPASHACVSPPPSQGNGAQNLNIPNQDWMNH